MPGTRCAVSVCKNSLKSTDLQHLNVSYHSFPKEPKLRMLWINACRRKDTWNPKTSVICSAHFKDDDFHLNFRRQLMNVKTKRFLKPGSVPSLLLGMEDASLSVCASKAVRKKIVESVGLLSCDNVDERSVERRIKQVVASRASEKYLISSTAHHLVVGTEDRYQQLQQRYEFLRIKYNLLRRSFNEQASKLVQLEKTEGKMGNDFAVSDGDDFNGLFVKVEPEVSEIVYLAQPNCTSSEFSNYEDGNLTGENKNEVETVTKREQIADSNVKLENCDVTPLDHLNARSKKVMEV